MGALAQPPVGLPAGRQGRARLAARFAGRPAIAVGAVFLFVLLVACRGGGGPSPTPTPSATAIPSPTPAAGTAPAPDQFDAQRALAHVQALAGDIGSRPAGSEAEAEAADYIASQLQAFGYSVEEQPFPFDAFVDLGTTLDAISPERRGLTPLPLRPTVAGLVEAEIVAAGLGRRQDFPPETDGRIALIERGQLFFSDKVANAAAAGAVAAIIYNDEPGLFQGDLRQPSAIPAVSISRQEGQFLLDLLDRGPVSVRLDVRVESGPRPSQNVIARPPDGQCQVYAGGHYDSVAVGPGANDNASGVATSLELARALAADGQFDAVCFIAFGAEEVGLVGSMRFVSSLSSEQRLATVAMLNFDMVGVGDRWLLGGTPSLADTAAQEADRLGLTYTGGRLPGDAGSDHASFQEVGIPAIIVHRLGDPHYHTAQDMPDFVDPNLIGEAGRLGQAVIQALLRGR